MEIRIERICVPSDFSETAQHAIHYGAALAKHHQAELHLLHVLQDVRAAVTHPDFTATDEEAHAFFQELEQQEGEAPQAKRPSDETRTRTFLRSLQQETHDRLAVAEEPPWWEEVRVHRATRYGKPVDEICRYARKHLIDLLILGTHGRTGVRHMLIGSVTERVVRTSPCPVLTVRLPGHHFLHGH